MERSKSRGRLRGIFSCFANKNETGSEKQPLVSYPIPSLPDVPLVIAGKYVLQSLIYSSPRSCIYTASFNRDTFIVKMSKPGTLSKEHDVYSLFHMICEDWGFGKALQYGVQSGKDILVMDYLGPSVLHWIQHILKGPLDLKKAVQVTYQVLYRLESLHNIGIVHGNVEPSNILIGRGDQHSDTVFLIDFSNSATIPSRTTSRQKFKLPDSRKPASMKFAPVSEHEGKRYCRRDDLESMMYVVAYMCKTTLPWDTADKRISEAGMNPIAKMKKTVDPSLIFLGLPVQFSRMLFYIKQLEDFEKPKYHKLRDFLCEIIELEFCDD